MGRLGQKLLDIKRMGARRGDVQCQYQPFTHTRRWYGSGDYPIPITPTWNETVNPWWVGAESDVSTVPDTVINEWVGEIAELRVWSTWRDESSVDCTKDSQLDGTEPNLLLRTSFDGDLTDATGNGFGLTAQDTATFAAGTFVFTSTSR